MDYSINVGATIFDWADELNVKTEIETKLQEYTANMKTQLGKDIVPAQIEAIIMSVSGVYNVNLSSPAFTTLEKYEWADCTSILVEITGAVNG